MVDFNFAAFKQWISSSAETEFRNFTILGFIVGIDPDFHSKIFGLKFLLNSGPLPQSLKRKQACRHRVPI
jgi:hypothetical protein